MVNHSLAQYALELPAKLHSTAVRTSSGWCRWNDVSQTMHHKGETHGSIGQSCIFGTVMVLYRDVFPWDRHYCRVAFASLRLRPAVLWSLVYSMTGSILTYGRSVVYLARFYQSTTAICNSSVQISSICHKDAICPPLTIFSVDP